MVFLTFSNDDGTSDVRAVSNLATKSFLFDLFFKITGLTMTVV